MILGRPTNLWTGLVTAALAVFQIIAVNVLQWDPVTTATLLGAVGIFLGSAIALIANQPPTVNEGDKIHVVTPTDSPVPNTTINATIPPLEPQP